MNGSEGRSVYVALEGKVYDLTASQLWEHGLHMNTHHAGQDLSRAIQAAPHGMEVFERFELVGELAEAAAVKPSEFPKPPLPLAKLLEQHPHPMTVHFPIALSITGAVFMFLYLVSGNVLFEKIALGNIIVAAIAAPFAITAGVMSWYYNYGAIWTPIYRRKAFLSVQLVVLQVIVLVVRGAVLRGGELAGPWFWVYAVLVVMLAPTVMGLGYFGGKITFPR